MPKMKTRAKGSKASASITVQNKFRIGTRKGGKSAMQMSSNDLRDVLSSDATSNHKYKPNARTVLMMRGEPLISVADPT